ncbi:uncharacterized protein LOC116610165 [Nematostella vectensis]|uniref:uncharacterized protein LOC116610165 n=1 Tax=Nematostella vectensis TaxID=45351 RepID=UPI002077172E|nr:uncharacterized protein LOC116610165 [Nematostella vectensis]
MPYFQLSTDVPLRQHGNALLHRRNLMTIPRARENLVGDYGKAIPRPEQVDQGVRLPPIDLPKSIRAITEYKKMPRANRAMIEYEKERRSQKSEVYRDSDDHVTSALYRKTRLNDRGMLLRSVQEPSVHLSRPIFHLYKPDNAAISSARELQHGSKDVAAVRYAQVKRVSAITYKDLQRNAGLIDVSALRTENRINGRTRKSNRKEQERNLSPFPRPSRPSPNLEEQESKGVIWENEQAATESTPNYVRKASGRGSLAN